MNNAKRARELAREWGSLAAYFWRWEPPQRARPRRVTQRALLGLAQTPESQALSRDLRKRAWTFVGPTTVYALMQAVGLVNDHLEGCAIRPRAEKARARFRVPRGKD